MGLVQFLLFLLLPFGAMVLASLSNPTVDPDVDQWITFELTGSITARRADRPRR